MATNVFAGKALVIITGASQGFGRALAISLSSRLKAGSILILLARNSTGLNETKFMIKNNIEIKCHTSDLSDPKEMQSIVSRCLENIEIENISQFMLINNAGSLGNVTLNSKDFTNYEEVNQYMSFNITSPMIITSHFINAVKKHEKANITIMNVTSRCGLQPWESYGMYSTGKAARDMYFKVLATDNPDLRVLSYAPGPLDTDMLKTGMAISCSEKVRSTYKNLYDTKTILSCEQSSEKFCALLEKNDYENGAHVDYYDF